MRELSQTFRDVKSTKDLFPLSCTNEPSDAEASKPHRSETLVALGNKFIVKDTRARGQGAYGTILLVEDRAFRLFAAKVETVSTSLTNEISLLQNFSILAILASLKFLKAM